jgi:hypothetical protein
MPRLITTDWPDHGTPDLPPPLTLPELRARLAALRAVMPGDALVIYGDREHAANIHWLTGFDPRFEEAVLIVTPTDALLIAGNECLPYTAISPLVQAGDIRTGHCASLSLPSQPRGGTRLDQWIATMIPAGATVGAIGWKWFGADEVADPATALDIPAFLADPLRDRAGTVTNATPLMMHPGHGLRARVDAAEIARLEFANVLAARALTRMVLAFRAGMTDFDAIRAGQVEGLPLGCHITFATGDRETMGLTGPTGQTLQKGRQISFNVCHWGSNICRAGWLADTADDLPGPARDYIENFVAPYVQAMADWCGLMVPGRSGGQVWQAMQDALPRDTYNLFLNPGHLIGLDEWLSSPIAEGSDIPLASGMAMQMDVIPGHPVYGSTRMEDGYVIADDALRAALSRDFPAVAARCAARADWMARTVGITVPPTLLPLADTCGIVAPFLLAPRQVVALT